MNRLNQILVAVLAVQIVIAGGIYYASKPMPSAEMQTALLDFDQQKVSRVTIVGDDGTQAVLSKSGDSWQLPDYHQLPADAGKLRRMLDSLASTRSGWPVANTSDGRERFKVGDDNFQKKVVLGTDGETLKTLYLGTSPGYRRLYVRRDGEDAVYEVKLDNYEISPENSQWLAATLLRPDGEIAALRGPGFELQKTDGKWQVASGTGEVVGDELDKVTGVLSRLRVTAAVDKPAVDADYLLKVDTADKKFTYHFLKDGDKRYVTRDDYDLAFEINQPDYDRIVGATAKQLVKGSGGGEQTSMDGSQHSRDTGMPGPMQVGMARTDSIPRGVARPSCMMMATNGSRLERDPGATAAGPEVQAAAT